MSVNTVHSHVKSIFGKLDVTSRAEEARVLTAEELRAARRRIRLLEQENEVLRRAAAYLSQANISPK